LLHIGLRLVSFSISRFSSLADCLQGNRDLMLFGSRSRDFLVRTSWSIEMARRCLNPIMTVLNGRAGKDG